MSNIANRKSTKIFKIISFFIAALLIFYILITFFRHYLHDKKIFIVVFWGIASIGIYVSYLISNFIAHRQIYQAIDEEQTIKLKVSIIGLTIYCWLIVSFAILIEKISFLNRYEQFCFWYLFSIVNTLIIFVFSKRVYFTKISALRGFRLWKVYVPKNFIRDEYKIQAKKLGLCVFLMEDKEQENAIDFVVEHFVNKDVNVNLNELISQIKCIEYKGFKYTPEGKSSFIAFEGN